MLSASPRNFHAQYQKGLALSSLNQYSEAIEAFDAAIAVKNDFGDAWLQKGQLLSLLGMNDRAVEAYASAGDYLPNSSAAFFGKGTALFETENYADAIQAFDQRGCGCRHRPEL